MKINKPLRRSTRIAATSKKLKREFEESSTVSEDKIKIPDLSHKKQKTYSTPIKFLQVGDRLPEIVLQDQDGNDVNFKHIVESHSNIVIFGMDFLSCL